MCSAFKAKYFVASVCNSIPILTQLTFQILIVTGGLSSADDSYWKPEDFLTSTEIFHYGQDTKWRNVDPLPTGRSGLRGAIISDQFVVSGGNYIDYQNKLHYLDDILGWDPVIMEWSRVGRMDKPDSGHTMTAVNLTSIFCNADP